MGGTKLAALLRLISLAASSIAYMSSLFSNSLSSRHSLHQSGHHANSPIRIRQEHPFTRPGGQGRATQGVSLGSSLGGSFHNGLSPACSGMELQREHKPMLFSGPGNSSSPQLRQVVKVAMPPAIPPSYPQDRLYSLRCGGRLSALAAVVTAAQ